VKRPSSDLHIPLASWLLPLVAACMTSQPTAPPVGWPEPVATREPDRPLPRVQETALYAADEALDDVLSSHLEYVGTGRWPSIERSQACAFRNRRVLVVNIYCTLTETHAFRIDVYSPQRGRVGIYAEANGRFSTKRRHEYFTFRLESAPPPGPETRLPPMTLAMSYEDLQSYERQRYAAFLPGCHGGEERSHKVGACLGSLAPQATEFAARNRAFLERGSDEWYRVIRQMRELAALYGRQQDE
jgi:hypothetical protein